MKYLLAFIVGGSLCLIGQVLIDKTKLTPARILVSYVVAGVILSGIGLYGNLVDVAGAGASLLASTKKHPFVRKHTIWFALFASIAITTVGLLLYQNVFSLFPIIAVLLHTGAFWLDNEKAIRIISLLGCPFWLVYNFVSGAYGSCIGDVLSMVSIVTSMIRYDLPRKNKL